MRTRIGSIWLAFVVATLLAPSARAQAPSGIAGVVKDTSGGALPGVTVEAASPALIEKVRSVITDGEGRYNIVDLRPGVYSVTFTLPGFSTFKRDGITLTIGFTATVNADMQVGSLEETITVTGEAPLVDTQNARQQKVMSADLMTALPTGQASVVSLIALTPGMSGNATVGGSTGAYHSQQMKGSFHGKTGSHIKFDGMRIDNFAGQGDSAGYLFNQQTVEETAVETGGAGAESGTPNMSMNMIPKEGGNTFRYGLTGLFTNHNLQSDNLTDDLQARGLVSVPLVDRMYDAGGTIGGPIRKDSVWFFTSIRRWGTKNKAAGLFLNKTQGSPFFTPDYDRPAYRDEKYQSHAARVTWQASQKNKLNFFVDVKNDCICTSGGAGTVLGAGAVNAQEGEPSWKLWPNGMVQGTWSSPLTSKLLLEAGASIVMFHWPNYLSPGVSEDDVSIVEQSTSMRYNSTATLVPVRRIGDRYAQRFAVSYVTGSHTVKAGFQNDIGYNDNRTIGLGRPGFKGVSYTFNNGVPIQLSLNAGLPNATRFYQKAELGIYGQDQWTIKRLTLSYGLRFDLVNGYVPAIHRDANQWLPAFDFPEVHDATDWRDINPRLGAALDLFGNGRTALKVAFGRYVSMSNSQIISRYQPQSRIVDTYNRPWTDANKNFIPDCNLTVLTTNGECGPINNLNFGNNDPNATQYADDIRAGYGARGYTWDFSSEVQHQITSVLSVTGGFYHNWSGSFEVTDNLAVGSSDYDPYCITAPIDARLPGGGGYQVCGMYDVKPAKFGQVTNLITQSTNYGEQKKYNDYVSAGVETRFRNGVRFGGGIDTGRSVDDTCVVVDSPQRLLNCRIVTGADANTQVKFNGSYPLPAGFNVSGTYQNNPGVSYTASYSAPTAQIAPSLGRPLAGGVRTAAVPLIAPQTLREPRRTQIDLRFSKGFQLSGRARLQANFDLYNVMNASSILGENNTYGANWRVPTSVLNGRLIQFGGNLTF